MKYLIILLFLLPLSCHASIYTDLNANRPHTLKVNIQLEKTAKYKVSQMINNKKLSHENPDVLSVFKKFNVKYVVAGEILSRGYDNKSVVKAWMDSPTHKAIIIDTDFNKVGCYCQNMWCACQFTN